MHNPKFSRRLNTLFYGNTPSILFLRHSGLAFAITIMGAGLAFVERFVLTQVLDVTTYGYFGYALSWANVLATIALLGLGTASLKFVAAYQETGSNDLLIGYIYYSTGVVLVLSTLMGLGLAGVVVVLRERMADDLMWTFFAVCLSIPFQAIIMKLTRDMLALRQVIVGQSMLLVFRPLLSIIGAIGVAWWFMEPSAFAVMVTGMLGLAALLVVGVWYLLHCLPSLKHPAQAAYKTGQWNETALKFAWSNILNIVVKRVDIILVGLFLGTTQAGIYSIAFSVAVIIDFGIQSINMVVAPLISRAYAERNLQRIQWLTSSSAAITTLYAVLATALMVIFGERLLHLFGKEYGQAYTLLLILTCGKLINSVFGSVGFLLSMTEYENQMVWILSLSSIIIVVCDLFFIPLLGIEGAALATLIGVIVWNTLAYIQVKRLLGIESTFLAFFRPQSSPVS